MPTNEVVIISANPRSGSHNRSGLVQELKLAIEGAGLGCELHTDLGIMAGRAGELASTGQLRTVVAAGGDGTASIVASLIPHHTPLTLFPTGSENLLAKHFGMNTDTQRCVRAIQRLETKAIDIMMVNGKLSLLMSSVGFDAEVVRRVHLARKSHVTKWTYWMAILQTLVRYRWPSLRIVIRDEQKNIVEEVEGSWVFVFSIPRYASGLSIIADAVEDDGLMDIGVFDRGGLFRGICNYVGVARGKHHQMKQWRHFRSPSISIDYLEKNQSANQGASCQTDGDWACELPVTIEVLDRKLKIVI
jgi:diacylglycerol kinase (ATP)